MTVGRLVQGFMLGALLLPTGCDVDEPGPGNAELSVVEFRVSDTESELRVVGVDVRDEVVAELRLTIGEVVVPDWDAPTWGRALEIQVHGKQYERFTSAGVAPLRLPRPQDAKLRAFLLDPYVASALERRGIGWRDEESVAVTDPDAEVAYSCYENYEYYPPCSGYGPSSYCMVGAYATGNYPYWEYEQWVVCADPTASRAIRLCNVGPGTTTGCGTTGGGGCAACPGWADGSGGYTYCYGGAGGACAFAN